MIDNNVRSPSTSPIYIYICIYIRTQYLCGVNYDDEMIKTPLEYYGLGASRYDNLPKELSI